MSGSSSPDNEDTLEVGLPQNVSNSEALCLADRLARVDLNVVSHCALAGLIVCLVLLCLPHAFLV